MSSLKIDLILLFLRANTRKDIKKRDNFEGSLASVSKIHIGNSAAFVLFQSLVSICVKFVIVKLSTLVYS